MKRKWIYLILAFVLILAGLGGYGLYIFKFKKYDVADPEVDKIVEDPFEITMPDGTELIIDKDGNVVEEKNSLEKNASNEEEGNDKENSSDGTEPTPPVNSNGQSNEVANPTKKLTVKEIKEKYMPAFKALESQANGNLDALVGRAANEYSEKKKNGERIQYGYFYNKYVGAAKRLEASTDAAFNVIMSRVENELKANGYDKAHAQSFRDEYNAAKEERRSGLLKKAREYF